VSNRQNDRPTEKLYYVNTSIVAVIVIHLVLRCGLNYKDNMKTHVAHLSARRRDSAKLMAEMDGRNL